MTTPHEENNNPASSLLYEALNIEDPCERQKYLERMCDGDGSLLSEVMSLLEHGIKWEDHVEESPDLVGRIISKYEIKSEIARGGMGTVYLGARTQDYKQTVAIKFINKKMLSQEGIRQFGKEMRIMASLNHPNLARLIDGGETEDGLRYVVMEYVEGQHIDAYCDNNRLTIKERLALFRKICSVVAYIHDREIIHRDIKPNNILVTDEGEPKLVDFGIAKALNPVFDTVTNVNLRPLSPLYASPEQVRGKGVGKTTDVYSLGVVLYELLTGHRAHKFTSDNNDNLEIVRVICETEMTRPSKVISVEERTPNEGGSALTPESVSASRGTQPRSLRRQLSGDLDCILLKALCKTPRHRYESVKALSADIDNHLHGRPVAARKGTWWKSFNNLTRSFVNNLPPTGLSVKMKLAIYPLLLAALVVAWQIRERTEQIRMRTAQMVSQESRQAKLQRAINTLSTHVGYHLRDMGKDKEERSGWESSQLAISNWRLKAFDESHVVNYLSMGMKEGCNCYEFPLNPRREENIAASGWVVLAMSKMKDGSGRTAPSAGQVEFILRNQNLGGGWWPIYSSLAESETDASTYATAISVLALYEYWKSGIKTYGDERKLRAAVEGGQAWLLSTRVRGKARWLDSPRNRAAKESVGLSGMVIHVLHRTEAAPQELNEIDRLWCQSLPALTKDAKIHDESDLPLSDGRKETTKNNVMQWAIVATAYSLASAPEAERRAADAWMNDIFDDIDNLALGVIENEKTDWIAAELLIALRQYRSDIIM